MFCKHGLNCISGLKFDIHQRLQGAKKFSYFCFQGCFLASAGKLLGIQWHQNPFDESKDNHSSEL